MSVYFGKNSLNKLDKVHPHLIVWVTSFLHQYPEYDLAVVEGKRTLGRQKRLVEQGLSWTMNSRHLAQEDGYSHAIDIYPAFWKSFTSDDWRTFASRGVTIAREMKLDIHSGWIMWGKDAFHFQLGK
jgi:peptidoglycan L-alanyl-D-glutamate endopeptidase CwlK